MATKEYIGHGTKHSEWNIIDVVLDMDKAQGFVYEFEGRKYLKFSVAQRQERSKYGATHTTYVRKKEESPMVAEPEPKRRRRAAKGQMSLKA
jgi:hypothetical protein